MPKRQIQILVAIGAPLVAIYSFRSLIHQSDTRYVVTQLNAARNTLEHSPPGIERAEEFVRQLKAINAAHAPTEVKQALAGYIVATEEGVMALRAQKDLTPFDRTMAEKKEALRIAIEKYQ